WGLNSFLFHLTNVVLIAMCAALVVVVVRRLTNDPRWAMGAGALFAIHPYHVENAGWIAARADVAATLLVLLSWLAYERWVESGRGFPWIALAAFEAALLFKESVVLFPIMVAVLVLLRRGWVRREGLAGIVPLALVAAAHFLGLRRAFLGDSGFGPASTLGIAWIKRGVDFFSGALIPVHEERIESHPALFALLAGVGLLVLCWSARSALRGHARAIAAAALLFLASLVPSLLSFQERYFFFPSVVSATVIAYLLLRMPLRPRTVAGTLLLAIWIASLGAHWLDWLQASRASRALVEGLTDASRQGVSEIVIANQPYRVAGVSLAGDLRAAVRLSGGRDVRIVAATALNLPSPSASGIDALPKAADEGVELEVRLPRAPFSGLFLPFDRPPGTMRLEEYGSLRFQEGDRVTVEIRRKEDGSRGAYAWHDGRLERLF
ncbi:MAG TPA: hypothetical protein VJ826_14190, partial [Candidatus Polarisedimenticolaceae bacterium]|nr:hypothetical protein [Candidatus Polarisedimenticolaceae bacterium]